MLTTAIPPAVRSIVAGSVGRLRGFGGTLASNPAPSVATTISVTPATASFALGDTQQFTATVLDQYGQPITQFGGGFGTPIIAWSSDSANVTIDTAGLATGAAYGTATVTATYQTLTGTAIATVQQPTKLAMVQQPAGATTGSAFTTQPIVTLQDALSASDGESGRSVTVAIGSGSGTLAGTTTIATNGAGQAVFTDLVITATSPPSNFTLTFSSSGLTGVTSASFSVASNLRTYATVFPATENPISESGNWVNGLANGTNWSNVRTTPGKAFGTQTGTAGLDDSWAHIAGATWAGNQEVTGTIINGGSGSTPGEVELLLHALITAGNARGYECLFSLGGAAEIVRWNGPLGDFTPLANASISFVTGDVVKARWFNGVITMYKNGVSFLSYGGAEASTWLTGNPGMGFFRRDTGPLSSDFGLSTWSATEV